jgi:flagellar biosynthesis protein FlhG
MLNRLNGSRAKTISFLSGKGGVGKTTLSMKMGLELVRAGRKVLLIDLDFNLSNSLVKIGKAPQNDHFYRLIAGELSLSEVLHTHQGLDILPACQGDIRLMKTELNLDYIIWDIVEEVKNQYDVIIFDAAAGTKEEILSLCARSDYRFFIINPDHSSLADAYSIVKMLSLQWNTEESHLIVNKVRGVSEAKDLAKRLILTAAKFSHHKIHYIGHVGFEEKFLSQFNEVSYFAEQTDFHSHFLKIVDKVSDLTMGTVLT